MAPFSSYKGLFQAPCTHYALLKAFTTNVTATSTSCWSVSLNMGHAQNFCASPSRENSQLLAHRYCRRAGITSCFNLSAKQQSNIMFLFFFFLLIFLSYRNPWARSGQVGMSTLHHSAQFSFWFCLQKKYRSVKTSLLRKLHLPND